MRKLITVMRYQNTKVMVSVDFLVYGVVVISMYNYINNVHVYICVHVQLFNDKLT